MKKVKISIQIPFFLRFVWIFLGNFGLVSIQITDFSRFVWTIFRKTPEKPKKVHTYLQKQAICMDFHKKLIIPCHSWIPHNCLAGRRAAAPLWPVGCPMPRGEGEVKSWQSLECWKKRGGWQPRSGRKTLYFPGALWHPRPKGAIRGQLCWNADVSFDKFGVVGVCVFGSIRKTSAEEQRSF